MVFHNSSPLSLDKWPFDLFIYFVRFIDAIDLLNLRLVNRDICYLASNRSCWRALAEVITRVGPVPVHVAQSLHALAHSDSADLTALIRSLSTASRVHRNWISPKSRQPILRKILVFQPGAQKRWIDIAALLPPESRYLISTEYYEEENVNKLTVSDIHLQTVCGTWPFPQLRSVMAYRPVDNGAAIMFVIQPEAVTSEGLVEYELVRFEFSKENDNPLGHFMSHSLFRQPREITDFSLSEDLILILDVEEDNTVSFEILNWRTGHLGRLRTGLISPQDPYNLNITGEYMALWVHSPVQACIYNYPMSLIEQCLRPDLGEIMAPPTPPLFFSFTESTTRFDIADYTLLHAHRSRKWETTQDKKLTDREMQVVQYWTPSNNHQLAVPAKQGQVRIAMAYFNLPIPFDGKPILRTWITERDVVLFTPPSGGVPFPFLEFNMRYGIWVEALPNNGGRAVKLVSLPMTEEERRQSPEWFEENRVKTFPIPSTFDLERLEQMSLDEPSGVLGLTFEDGRLWLLYFDGHEDDQYNITTETLKIMFPDHVGEHSLNREVVVM